MSASRAHRRPGRILAIDPTPRGFAFAVLEGTELLVDWGVVRIPRPHTLSARS